jgi:MFS family permease
MYAVQDTRALVAAHRRLFRKEGGQVVGRTVLLLGLVSLFTDISAEMVATVLPLYLIYTLGLSPLAFGFADGLYQGAAALVRVASGFAGDRLRRHKAVAVVGYGLSAACKVGYLVVGGVLGGLSAVIMLDRTGKGIRTAPRDALISLSTPRDQLGTAFGVHRALDTAGAMIGPLLAFALLMLAPGRFDVIFVVSFCFAVVGLAILVLFVDERRNPTTEVADADPREAVPDEPAEREDVSMRAAAALLGQRRFATLVGVSFVLGIATISDAFIYLSLQRRLDFEMRYLPLLFVGTALVYMVLAAPIGRLADRLGRGRVFVAGYVMLLAVYATVLIPSMGPAALALCLLLFGTYYASTDGVLAALGSAIVPDHLRGSGLAFLTTATGIARLVGSVAFGALWTFQGLQFAVVAFGIVLVLAAAAALVLLRGENATA